MIYFGLGTLPTVGAGAAAAAAAVGAPVQGGSGV